MYREVGAWSSEAYPAGAVLLGSVSHAVIHGAASPVAVVPEVGSRG